MALRMLSTRFEAPLRVRPERSRLLALILSSVHLSALAVLPFLSLPHGLAIMMGIGVLLSLYRSVYTHVLLSGSHAIRELVWEPSGEVVVWDGDGHESEAVLRESVAHPWIIVLNLRLSTRSRRTLVLLPDSAPAEVLRQLRTRLRLGTAAERID